MDFHESEGMYLIRKDQKPAMLIWIPTQENQKILTELNARLGPDITDVLFSTIAHGLRSIAEVYGILI